MRTLALLSFTLALTLRAGEASPVQKAPQGDPEFPVPQPITIAAPEPKAASVSLYGGVEIKKCLVEKQETGAWIIWEGHRYWYQNNYILKIVYLEGPMDAELTEWLRKANAARDEAAKRAAESDAERASKAGEGANGPATAGGAPEAGGASTGTGGGTGSGAGTGSTGKKGDDKKGGTASSGSGSSGSTESSGGSSGGSGGGAERGPDRRNVVDGLNRADDWRVLDIDRAASEMLLRNRLFKQEVRVNVEPGGDLDRIRRGDILHGNIGAGESTLTSNRGASVRLTPASTVGK